MIAVTKDGKAFAVPKEIELILTEAAKKAVQFKFDNCPSAYPGLKFEIFVDSQQEPIWEIKIIEAIY